MKLKQNSKLGRTKLRSSRRPCEFEAHAFILHRDMSSPPFVLQDVVVLGWCHGELACPAGGGRFAASRPRSGAVRSSILVRFRSDYTVAVVL